jgi:hypothetical protein
MRKLKKRLQIIGIHKHTEKSQDHLYLVKPRETQGKAPLFHKSGFLTDIKSLTAPSDNKMLINNPHPEETASQIKIPSEVIINQLSKQAFITQGNTFKSRI